MSKYDQIEEDIKKIIAKCPKYYREKDLIKEVSRKVRLKRSTVKDFLKNLRS